ncbi:hypothetical protein MBRA1_001606 [Malassezia brasiliensis]|uniref:RING-type domain-containing protein n=1 Tax=Malassezia brasiliensis TaxID=1821822 RepID=A0AAF0ISI0_9BASI|nr:hypothetical protein MBRA1_001606 [Malassezia brasiliensis]
MGASHSRNARERAPPPAERSSQRRTREESESADEGQATAPFPRRRRLGLGRSLGLRRDEDEDGERNVHTFARNLRRRWGRNSTSQGEPDSDADAALAAERRMTMRILEHVVGRALDAAPTARDSVSGPRASASDASSPTDTARPGAAPTSAPTPHPAIDPTSLRGTMGPDAERAQRASPLDSGAARRTSSFGTLLSEVLGASRGARQGSQPSAALPGTSVIVQGALVARTAPSDSTQRAARQDGTTAPGDAPGPSDTAATDTAQATGAQPSAAHVPPAPEAQPGMPHVATLEEQGEMLGRILRIATAATAASLVSNVPPTAAGASAASANTTDGTRRAASEPRTAPAASATAPSEASAAPAAASSAATSSAAPTAGPATDASDSPTTPTAASSGNATAPSTPGMSRDMPRLDRQLFAQLAALSPPARNETTREQAPSEPETMSTISHLMREALRTSSPSSPHPSSSEPRESNSAASAVLSTLEHARQGTPLTQGEPGTFERFLYDLIQDLTAAVVQIDRDSTSRDTAPPPAPESDPAVHARREGDLSWGQLSFFRLFRFERTAESLTPCVLVGVRSLRADEQLMGSDDGQAGTSRFILFVSGGRYDDHHPLLTSRPRDAGRDLMFMMELLGTMVALSSKPQTASAADIARSGLLRVRACELPALQRDGKVTENTSEKCLVCLEEWQDADECRVLNCHHAFHAACVDQWLEQSRSQAVPTAAH